MWGPRCPLVRPGFDNYSLASLESALYTYCIPQEVDADTHIYHYNLNLTEVQQDDFKSILDAQEGHFKPMKSAIYDNHKFEPCKQEDGKKIALFFFTRLKEKVVRSKYGQLKMKCLAIQLHWDLWTKAHSTDSQRVVSTINTLCSRAD